MPVYLQVVTGASATKSGLLLLPLMLAGTASTAAAGRAMSRTGRYKAFPVIGLALMAAGLGLLAQIGPATPYGVVAALLVLFGARLRPRLAGPDRRDPERGRPPRPRHRDRVGQPVPLARRLRRRRAVRRAVREPARRRLASRRPGREPVAVADALHTVFLAAAPVAALGVLVVLTLKEVPLRHA